MSYKYDTGGAGGSGVVIIKVPDTVVGTFSGGVDFGNNAPDYDNGLPITSVAGFNIYFVSGTDTASETVTFAPSFTADFLVIAGGGSGGGTNGGTTGRGGGGGAGGYRCSVTGESSGGGASAESKLTLAKGTAYTVTIGAGGPSANPGSNGNSSVFSTITSTGGGHGGKYGNPTGTNGNPGGSGGGGGSGEGGTTTGGG
jgi:hypothetical protein